MLLWMHFSKLVKSPWNIGLFLPRFLMSQQFYLLFPLSTSQMLDFLQDKTSINNQKLIDMVVKMARGRSWLWLTLLKELEKDGDLAEFFVDGFSQFLQQDSQYLKLQFLKKIQEFWMLDLFIDALISYYVDAWDQSSIEAWIEVKKMRNQSINEENLLRYGILS